MGAWGSGPFDNDDAGTFESQLVAHGRTVIASALRGACRTNKQDERWCSVAIAAAEVIAAANGHPLRGLATTAADACSWIKETGYHATRAQAEKAAAIVTELSASSALADLWRESGGLTAWRRSQQSLAKRLAKPPLQKTRATSPPRRVAPNSNPKASHQKAEASLPISRRTAKQILVKKAGGMLYDHLKGSVDVLLSRLKKVTRADAASLATIPDVREIDLQGMQLASDKQSILATLLDGWKNATRVCAESTKGVAAFLIPRLHDFKTLASLDLARSDVTDADLRGLAGQPTLKNLDLSGTRVTEAAFAIARQLPALKQITLYDCPAISIESASRFAVADEAKGQDRLHYIPATSLLGLSTLTLARQKACAARNNPVANTISREWNVWVNLLYGHAGFGELPDLDRLTFMAKQCLIDSLSIGLNQSPIRQEAADRLRFVLAAWPGIRRLSIGNAKTFDDSMASEVARLTSLESLEIDSAKISDVMASTIAGLVTLRRLQLTRTNITSASLKPIVKMPNLRWLTLSANSSLPREAVLKLRKQLAPQCYVECL